MKNSWFGLSMVAPALVATAGTTSNLPESGPKPLSGNVSGR